MNNTLDTSFINERKPEKSACVELFNGRFVDVVGGDYFNEKVRVLLKDGKIEAMPGLAGQPSGVKPDFAVDLKGKTIMPGLINTHCHTTQTMPSLLPDIKDIKLVKAHAEKQARKNLAECLIHGITNIRDAWAADLRKSRRLRQRIQNKEIMGPRIMQGVAVGPPGGYLTEKHNRIMKWTRAQMGVPAIDYGIEYCGSVEFDINAGEQQVRDAVDRAIDERGAECIKIGEQKVNMTNFKPDATIMTLDQLSTIADQALKRGLKSTIHHTSVESFRRALKAGVSSLAHIPCDQFLTDDDINLFLNQSCFIEPTMSVSYDCSYKIQGDPSSNDSCLTRLTGFRNQVHDDIIKEFWIPEYQTMVKAYHKKASHEKMKIFGILPVKTMFKNFVSYCTYGAENFRLLFEKGAPITISNDGGIPPCTLAMVQHEIRLFDLFLNKSFDRNIFSGVDAVRMATINGARCMGIENDFGTIDVGKTADLAVFDGNPFQDHTVLGKRVAALFKDGELVINNCMLQYV